MFANIENLPSVRALARHLRASADVSDSALRIGGGLAVLLETTQLTDAHSQKSMVLDDRL
ncbi:hypothetical protein Caka_1397 [Coraliomargarita akajimensis DSM 45221]|uniref:Uncharacterized protein n=1 Tax=Coraliomargarita akajimensis (strain DSM 45221 / IAM 15411 / JCM 23193 / KCTC 12865 / 04OKA010-24) TaxID=583355 RepID=D5EJ17_CORAD|nr:hypothetical protein Caka_1397 [Coraliomargarita akajimensis DSM 45221]